MADSSTAATCFGRYQSVRGDRRSFFTSKGLYLSAIVIATILVFPFEIYRPFLYTTQSSKVEEKHPPDHCGDTKYLVYYSHSGFSNQIIGLQRAAQLALATERTLVLPPVLPHTEDKSLRFKKYRPRAAGSDCSRFRRSTEFVEIAKKDANNVVAGRAFPSFLELVDFSLIQKETGLSFVDLPDFMNRTGCSDTSSWYEGRLKEVDYYGFCTTEQRRTYDEMVKLFHTNFGSAPIAVIGTAYIITNDYETYSKKGNFSSDRLFKAFPPSNKLLRLLKMIQDQLPEHYAGVHIRFRDKQIVDCTDPELKAVFDRVQDGLLEKNVTRGSTIIVGNSHKNLTRCVNQSANGTYFVTTLDDIIESDAEIQRLIKGIELEKSTVDLVLDQIFIALADNIVMQTTMRASTFQQTIQVRHQFKEDILSRLSNLHT